MWTEIANYLIALVYAACMIYVVVYLMAITVLRRLGLIHYKTWLDIRMIRLVSKLTGRPDYDDYGVYRSDKWRKRHGII